MDTEKAREARVRRKARRVGYQVQKSRLRGRAHADDFGGYRLVDLDLNAIVLGEKFDATLSLIEGWVEERES